MLTCQRHLFSLPPDQHYLNCAYMAPLSKRVEQAGIDGIRRKARPYTISAADFFEETHRARALFAGLLGEPDPQRVAVIPSASYGFAQLAANTPVGPGQNIVTAAEEFPSNVYIWRRVAADSGATLRAVEPPVAGAGRAAAWSEALLAAIDSSTAIVSVARVNWADGALLDLEAIGQRARAVGAAFLVDGSQSIGAEPFDLSRVQPDGVVCPAYKWLMGPYSLGFAWFGPRYAEGRPIEESWLIREGSEDFAGLVRYVDRYRPGSIRYDVGETPNFALMPMAIAALEQLTEWTPAAIAEYTRALTAGLAAELRERGYEVADDAWRAGHLFGVRLPGGADPEAVRRRLAEERVWVSVRGTAVRIAAHLYNDDGDVAALLAALR